MSSAPTVRIAGGRRVAVMVSLVWGVHSAAAEREPSAWPSGFAVTPYGWLAGFKGTVGSGADDVDPGTGISFPPRLDFSVDEELEEIGFMFNGTWYGNRWMGEFDSVWVNVKLPAQVKFGRLLPASSAEAGIDGNIYQLNAGYRVADWPNSVLAVTGGIRYYDIEALAELSDGILPSPIATATNKTWMDGAVGVKYIYRAGGPWTGSAAADVGTGDPI